MLRTCINCNKQYEINTKSLDNNFCSELCEMQYCYKYDHNLSTCSYKVCICKHCGRQFISCSEKEFCSIYCRQIYNQKQKPDIKNICVCCGKVFYSKKKKDYCSKNCASRTRNKNIFAQRKESKKDEYEEISKRKLHEQKEKEWLGQTTEGFFYERELDVVYGTLVECETCKRKYFVAESHKDDKHHYCCYKCFSDSERKLRERICLNCSNEFYVGKNDFYTQFCSDKCENNFYQCLSENMLPAILDLEWYECINCHKKFLAITNHSVMFCSGKCKDEFSLKRELKTFKCLQCGKKFSSCHNAKFCSIACSSLYNAKSEEFKERIKNKNGMQGKKRTLASRDKQSKTVVKKIMSGELIPNSDSVQGYYKNIPHFIRSTWEANFALILNYLNRDYRYESKSFKIEDGSRYLPDFYDVKRNLFYEIKGSWKGDSQEKMKKFVQQYPYIKVHVIDRKKYIRIYKFFAKKIRLVESFHNCKIDSKFDLMTKDEFKKIKITKEKHEEIFNAKTNPYKKWEKKFDDKLKKSK